MKDSFKIEELEERARIIEETLLWWEDEMDKAILKYEEAEKTFDADETTEASRNIKSLLKRADFEKKELEKVEAEINKLCAKSAFEGKFLSNRRKKNE